MKNTLQLVVWLTLGLAACGGPDPISFVETPAPPAPAPEVPAVPVVTLTAFTIAPRADTLVPGDTLRFRAKAIYSDSVDRPVTVTWNATGGTMDSTGLFTASNVLGRALVLASCACGAADGAPAEVHDSVAVTIQAGSRAVLEVPLRLHRMDGGSGDVLVSNGIPLPPGWLPNPSATPPVRITIGGAEVPSYVEVLKGKHKDGSVMSVLVQFVWPRTASGDAVFQVATTSALPARTKVDLSGAMPAAAALPIDPEYLVSTLIVGPTVSRFQAPQSPGFFQQYEQRFDEWSTAHWASYGHSWVAMNYYDRVLNHFAFYVRTGNPVLWERAARIAVDYRKNYLEANDYGSSEWWAQLDGLALHYWFSGDPASRVAVYRTAESLHSSRGGAAMANTSSNGSIDNRNHAKVLSGKVLSMRLESPNYGAVQDWMGQARQDLGWILQTQTENGSFVFLSSCGHSANFMTGMLTSALIDYYEQVEADARIPVVVAKFQNWLWDTQWRPEAVTYNYFSGFCAGKGDAEPAGDLNGFYLEAYGWLYQQSGDPKYRERGDATFSGLVDKTWFTQPKMFNQAFQFSWRYLAYRR